MGRQGPPHDPDRDGCGPAMLRLMMYSVALVGVCWLVWALSGFQQ